MTISALGEKGKAVDWWFIYKVPHLAKGANSASTTGYEYVYYDPQVGAVKPSPNRLDQGKGALHETLTSPYKPAPTTGWILYNDEMPAAHPAPDDGNKGHTKGVIAFDTASKTAYWLLHSWPKFADPGATERCQLPSTDKPTCASRSTWPPPARSPRKWRIIRSPRLPSANGESAEDRSALPAGAASERPIRRRVTTSIICKSKGGLPFKVIAKNKEWNKDFWNDLVGPTLERRIWMWRHGSAGRFHRSRTATASTKRSTSSTSIWVRSAAHWAWPETHDHAKWGITLHSDWVCVGDINRMISQRKRGGGTIAFQNHLLWQALSKTDLILAPPGHTREEALQLIQSTHVDPNAPVPAKRPAKKK